MKVDLPPKVLHEKLYQVLNDIPPQALHDKRIQIQTTQKKHQKLTSSTPSAKNQKFNLISTQNDMMAYYNAPVFSPQHVRSKHAANEKNKVSRPRSSMRPESRSGVMSPKFEMM